MISSVWVHLIDAQRRGRLNETAVARITEAQTNRAAAEPPFPLTNLVVKTSWSEERSFVDTSSAKNEASS